MSGGSHDFDAVGGDASLRAGIVLRPVGDVFLNLRCIGGGATGPDETPDPPRDGGAVYRFRTLSPILGVQVRWAPQAGQGRPAHARTCSWKRWRSGALSRVPGTR